MESTAVNGWPIILKMAVSSYISGDGVMNEMPGVKGVSSEHEIRSDVNMMIADINFFIFQIKYSLQI